MARVLVAMSGGVDSSVAAAMLVDEGHDVVGVFMRHGQPALAEAGPLPVLPQQSPRGGSHQGCCSVADAMDARRVADRLGIPLYPLELSDDFDRIIGYFVDEYGRGRTPNPCVRCNTWLKFGRLFDYADAVGAAYVATGHHARLEPRIEAGFEPAGPPADAAAPALLRGRDRAKDQSYVLFDLEPGLLSRMLLPVGHLLKEEVRGRASSLGLSTADKPDSQEICFVAPGDHARLVASRLGGSRAGEIVSTDGTVLGRHEGIEHFTVGQRQGLGVAVGRPLYVVRIDADRNRVVVGGAEEVPCRKLVASSARWLVPSPDGPFEALVQVRSARAPAPATVTPLGGRRFAAEFDPAAGSPGAISPGQAAVCYVGDRVVGGGWIE
jgi:tRNA-specific 2-thiouridylase